jgi:hypothetical protein
MGNVYSVAKLAMNYDVASDNRAACTLHIAATHSLLDGSIGASVPSVI